MSEPTRCHCGAENFYRVTVDRRRSDAYPYRTDFVACAECRAMYHYPEPATQREPLDPDRAGIGGPPHAPMSTEPIPYGPEK